MGSETKKVHQGNQKQAPGTTALKRYFNPDAADHFYTAFTHNNCGGREGIYNALPAGYNHEGDLGFCFCDPTEGTVPLFQYYSRSVKDHFYTTNPNNVLTESAWECQGLLCYVYPS